MNQSNSMKKRALIVDDERGIRESLTGVIEDENWQCDSVESGEQALVQVKRNRPHLIFLDIWMAGMDGIATLQRLREVAADVPVVIMSGHATIDLAVRATRLGAFDVLEKPLVLDRILAILKQTEHLMRQKVDEEASPSAIQLIGASPQITAIKKQIAAVGPKNASVLITGPNGVGKEVVARLIHQVSPRASKSFVAINCAAIPEELIESELFGHVKGAFTNASSDRKGRFELADGGTLFLDEIGDMSLKTQAKILRILQERTFERVGDHRSISVNVRIIAATNRDLQSEIKAGTFREDLYYRLNVIPIHVPPLKDRKEDIPDLIDYFWGELSKDAPKKSALSLQVLSILKEWPWPGNVRELKNVLERLAILSAGDSVALEHLPPEFLGDQDGAEMKSSPTTLRDAKSDFERAFIIGKLEENDWNVSKTAEALQVERSNLHRKLKGYDIDPKKLKG